jgi:Holliday junction DNA helicase RuvA
VIASVRGTVTSIALDHAVIEVSGVGFAVRTTPSTLAGLRRGEQATLSTSLVVREDSLTLYGFATSAAKELFELVQSVSGVGPKIALALLAVLDPDELRRALAGSDATTLMRAPGIGRKGAERLILELKDKVGPASAAGPTSVVAGTSSYSGQLIDALAGLGFTAKQSSDAVAEVTADPNDPAVANGDVSVLLRRALGLLGRSR